MKLPSPFEFALASPCFACGAQAGCPCVNGHGEAVHPHFGRAGMPSGRGWVLRVGEHGCSAERRLSRVQQEALDRAGVLGLEKENGK